MTRPVLRIEALFEVVLAAYLVVAVVLWPAGVRMADPVPNGVLIAVAAVLAAAGAAIWWLSRRPRHSYTSKAIGLFYCVDPGRAPITTP